MSHGNTPHLTSDCLTDVDVQMLADDRPLPEAASHAASCDRCTRRVAARRRLMDQVTVAAHDIALSPARAAAIAQQVREQTSGATTLRPVQSASRSRWIAVGAAIAATLLLVAILPRLDRTETVSASEILGRSRAALASTPTGIETLTYDLALDGVLSQLLPDEQAGRFLVEEVIDHDNPGRFRIMKLAADGTPVGGAAEDPVAGQRVRYIRVNGRGYLLRFDAASPLPLALPAVKRAALQSFVTLMQGQPRVAVTEGWRDGERVFVVEIPQDGTFSGALPFALSRGRAVIAADDARLVEVDAAGTIADQPFSISFALRARELHGGPPAPGQFDIPPRPDDVVLDGSATTKPMWDVVTRALREVDGREARR
jgi:hypothetical protein